MGYVNWVLNVSLMILLLVGISGSVVIVRVFSE